jgi:hypothetical protein
MIAIIMIKNYTSRESVSCLKGRRKEKASVLTFPTAQQCGKAKAGRGAIFPNSCNSLLESVDTENHQLTITKKKKKK